MGVKRKREAEDQGEVEEDEVAEKPTATFSLRTFRKSLRGEECFSALKQFTKLCRKSDEQPDVAVQFLEKGGGVHELLHVLDAKNTISRTEYAILFGAVHIVVMRTLTAVPTAQTATEEACRHLLGSHLHTIHYMLSLKSNARHKKVMLQLLTALVSLSVSLAREILSHVTFNPPVLETLTQTTSVTERNSVRTCFIHFILAFLVDGDIGIIRPLLEKRGFLTRIVRDLQFDRAEQVVLVLTTLRTKVLENIGISKTSKLHTFNTHVVQSLLALYDWKGPSGWVPKFKKRRKDAAAQDTNTDQQMVAEAVHALLLVLCTSHKFGIVFHDRSLGTSTHGLNNLVLTILESLEHPWKREQQAELVVETLRACPDLIRTVIKTIKPFLEPRASQQWLQIISLVKQIMLTVDLENCLIPCVSCVSIPQLVSAVLAVTIPGPVLQSVGTSGLQHEHPAVRHEVASLLGSMLNQHRSAMLLIEQKGKLPATDLLQFKQGITNHVTMHLPDGETLYKAWRSEFSPIELEENTQSLPVPSVDARMVAILDLILSCYQCCPYGNTNINSAELIKDLHNLPDMDPDKKPYVQVKILQLLLEADITVFSPNKEQFGEEISSLFRLARHPTTTVSKLAHKTLVALLQSTGLFDGSGDELNVWLHCYLVLPLEHCDDVAHFLTKTLIQTVNNLTTYIDRTLETKEEGECDTIKPHMQLTRLDDIFTELTGEVKEREYITSSSFTELSPLLACALEEANSEPTTAVVHYLSCVAVHLLHSQLSPNTLSRLVGQWPHLPSPVAKYIQGWHFNGMPAPLKKPFGPQSPESKLSRALLQPEECSSEAVLNFDDVSNPIHKFLLFKLTLFHVAQLALRGKLSEVVCKRSRKVLVRLLRRVQTREEISIISDYRENYASRCLKYALAHPLLVQFFSPLHKKKHIEEQLLTELALELLKKALSIVIVNNDVRNLMIPFKRKFLSCIAQVTTRPERALRVSKLLPTAAELLQLSVDDMTELLGHIATLSSEVLSVPSNGLSPWGFLLAYLLQHTKEPAPASTVSATAKHLTNLSLADVDVSELDEAFCQYLRHFPHCMADIPPETCKVILQCPSRVGALLLECNKSLLPMLLELSLEPKNLVEQPTVFLPLLAASLCHSENQTLLDAAFKQYHSYVETSVLKPSQAPDWVKDHIKTINLLISRSMEVDVCKRLCKKLAKRYLAFHQCETFHLSLLECVFTRSSVHSEHLVLLALDQLSKALLAGTDRSEVIPLCERLLERSDVSWESARGSTAWCDLPVQMLRLGMNPDEDPLLLSVLAKILNRVFTNTKDTSEAALVFEMAFSHSKFVSTMLGADSANKRGLLELLLVLTKSDPSTMQASHVPVLLGAYSASLALTDQLILELLHQYESYNVSLHEYRPYLWGEAAVSHYSVRAKAGLALWRVPKSSQVLDLLKHTMMEATIKNFPKDRPLQVSDSRHPDCPEVYDPAFLLPLLSHLLAPESVVHTHKVSTTGTMALMLVALSSNCSNVRAAAGHVLARFHAQLEAGRVSKEEQLLLQFSTVVRNGVISLMEGKDKDIPVPQLPGVVATFLARASLVMSQPLNSLYAPLHAFVLAKPVMDLNTVPELLELLHSDHVDFRIHRQWILEVIRDGLQNEHDADVTLQSPLYKLLLDLFQSVLSDKDTKVLILQVLGSALKLPKVTSKLLLNHGLIAWLQQTVGSFTLQDVDLVVAMIHVLSSLQSTLKKVEVPLAALDQQILNLLVMLLSSVPPVLSEPDFCQFLNAVAETQCVSSIQIKHLRALIELCKNIFGIAEDCEQLLQYGSQFVIPSGKYSETLCCMRGITLTWIQGQSKE